MSFIHVHMIQRPKAIHVYGYKSVKEPVKANKKHNFFHIFAVCKHKKALINAWVESYGSDLTG